LVHAAATESHRLVRELEIFRAEIRSLNILGGELRVELDTECDRPDPASLPEEVLG
jgi:hypothetical protein